MKCKNERFNFFFILILGIEKKTIDQNGIIGDSYQKYIFLNINEKKVIDSDKHGQRVRHFVHNMFIIIYNMYLQCTYYIVLYIYILSQNTLQIYFEIFR